jgi:hypothetical protein
LKVAATKQTLKGAAVALQQHRQLLNGTDTITAK